MIRVHLFCICALVLLWFCLVVFFFWGWLVGFGFVFSIKDLEDLNYCLSNAETKIIGKYLSKAKHSITLHLNR